MACYARFTAILFAGGALALGGMPPFGMFDSELQYCCCRYLCR